MFDLAEIRHLRARCKLRRANRIAEMTWEILRQIEHADQVGFDVYSVIDHHFFQKFSSPRIPLRYFPAAAQRTERNSLSRGAVHTPTRKPDAAGRPNRRS